MDQPLPMPIKSSETTQTTDGGQIRIRLSSDLPLNPPNLQQQLCHQQQGIGPGDSPLSYPEQSQDPQQDSHDQKQQYQQADDQDQDQDQDQVYNFDASSYNQNRFRLIAASRREFIWYSGRFLHHGRHSRRKTKVNTVQFDWSGVSFSIRVRNTTSVGIRLKGDGNYFNVFVNGSFRCILRATLYASCCEIASELDASKDYTITVSKRTEPQMRGAMSTFKICTFYGFLVEKNAVLEPLQSCPNDFFHFAHRIEFIGASETCAFGNEGEASSAKHRFGLKGRMENVYNGFACITARMFDAEAHVLGWSGKGVHSNNADWGPNMLALWKNTLASREGQSDLTSWIPEAVVIMIGSNDLFPPASSEAEIVEAYRQLVEEVRHYRPKAHIFCAVCDENCLTCEDSESNRQQVSLRLQEITKVAILELIKTDQKIHYTYLKIPDGGLQPSDYATHMHYAVSGHVKIAQVLAQEIALHTNWQVLHKEPELMPFPPDKKEILVPKEERAYGRNCIIA